MLRGPYRECAALSCEMKGKSTHVFSPHEEKIVNDATQFKLMMMMLEQSFQTHGSARYAGGNDMNRNFSFGCKSIVIVLDITTFLHIIMIIYFSVLIPNFSKSIRDVKSVIELSASRFALRHTHPPNQPTDRPTEWAIYHTSPLHFPLLKAPPAPSISLHFFPAPIFLSTPHSQPAASWWSSSRRAW